MVQVVDRGTGERLPAQALAQPVQLVFQRLGQVGRANSAHIRRDERPLQEARDQRRVGGRQQAPGRVVGAQAF